MVAVVVVVETAAEIVAVTIPILLLKIPQSVDDRVPLLVADAAGRLKVCIWPEETILKELPVVPVAKVWAELVNPFNEVIALSANKFEKSRVVILPFASAVSIFVLVVLVPMPANLTSRVVWSCAVGEEIPIPTLPRFLL